MIGEETYLEDLIDEEIQTEDLINEENSNENNQNEDDQNENMLIDLQIAIFGFIEFDNFLSPTSYE